MGDDDDDDDAHDDDDNSFGEWNSCQKYFAFLEFWCDVCVCVKPQKFIQTHIRAVEPLPFKHMSRWASNTIIISVWVESAWNTW